MFAQYLQALHADAEGAAGQQQGQPSSAPPPSGSSSSSAAAAPPASSLRQPAMDLDSDSAFPALGASSGKGKGSSVRAPQPSGWASATSRQNAASAQPANGSNPALSAAASPAHPLNAPPPATAFRDHVSVPSAEIHLSPPSVVSQMQRKRNEDLPPTSVGEAAAITMKHHPSVKVEASSSKNAATFHFAGPTEAAVLKAKADLLSRIVKKVSIVVQVPGSTRPFIIGQKGRTLKAIQDESGAHIQLPPKDAAQDDFPTESSDELQEPIFPVTVTGTQYSCDLARARIEAIVAERASKVVHTAKIPASQFEASVWPFVRAAVEPNWQADLVDITYTPGTGIEVKSDSKEKCQKWAQLLSEQYTAIKSTLKSASLNIPKSQHRFLRDPVAIARIHEETGFVIELPPLDSPEEIVILRGRAGETQGRMQAMGAVVELAESGQIGTVDLSQYFKGQQSIQDACRYFSRKPHVLNSGLGSGVTLDLPTRTQVTSGNAQIELVGQSADTLQSALQHVQQTCQLLSQPDRLANIDIDTLHHKHLLPGGSKAKQVKALQDKYAGADIVFPQSGSSSGVLVAWTDANEQPALSELRAELKAIVSELGHVDSVSLEVPQNLHDAIRGPNSTTVNVLVGEQKATAIDFGPGDKVTIRGAKNELQRVKKDLEALVKRAQSEDITTIHEANFDLEARFVGYIVGKNGAGVNKLNSELGVRVQFEDVEAPSSAAAGDATVVKKKKSSKPRVHVTIRGRRENVEEAQKRIIAHAERVADETTTSVPLPTSVDRRILIGKQGTYVQRLEAKFEVRILFPKADDTENAITIRGPRKGVEGAKKEICELIDYEVENSHTATIKVPVKAVPRIVGRGGAQVNDIMAESGASIDVESPDGTQSEVNVTLKGTKEAVAAAKKAVQAISQETVEETVINLTVAKSLQAGLVGRGGQNLKDLIVKCGGPADGRSQGAMVRLPRPGDAVSDQITLRGKRSIVEKLQKEIEAHVAREESRVLYGVSIPKSSHASIIGRGGVGINELSAKHNVRILFPNWKENSVGSGDELVNASEVQDAEPESLIRIVGAEEDCKTAAEEMLRKQASTPLRTSRSATPQTAVTKTVEVPAQHHRIIADAGRFFRRHVPPRVNIDHGDATLPPPLPKPTAASSTNGAPARIDIDEEEPAAGSILEAWEIFPLSSDDGSSTIPWVITGQNEEAVAKAEAAVQAAVERVKGWTHIAYARVGRSNMPRVIGKGGSGLDHLRTVSGGDVEALGRKDADTVSITGPEEGLLAAKAELEKLEQR